MFQDESSVSVVDEPLSNRGPYILGEIDWENDV